MSFRPQGENLYDFAFPLAKFGCMAYKFSPHFSSTSGGVKICHFPFSPLSGELPLDIT
jgi:hypothetical protein